MNRNVLICLLSGSFSVASGMITFAILFSNDKTVAENMVGIVLAGLALFIGVMLFILASYLKLSWWNGLSVDGRADEIATELKSGKRDWYLNPMQLGNYMFAPLRPSKMNELGGGKHIKTNRLMVDSLLAEGKLENDEMTRKILYHFDSIL
ncbi:MAG: hypothetical protein WCN88_03425 [Candidatus Falkowbacteria bacterium]